MNSNPKFRVWDKRGKQFLQELAPYYWHNPHGDAPEPEGEANLCDLSYFLLNQDKYTRSEEHTSELQSH